MMRKLTDEEAREQAERYGLKPVRIKGSNVVQLAKNISDRYEVIPWDVFFSELKKKRLAVYISKGGYMKIMGDDVYE